MKNESKLYSLNSDCPLCILTPTFNRKEYLPNLYKSLLNQINKSFTWLVIDDGSTDNTKELIEKWKQECESFKIRYYYKENGGKHTALNWGFKIIKEPLTFIVDSDDRLSGDAVQKVLLTYNLIKQDVSLCGIVFLRGKANGECVGDRFRKEGIISWNDMRYIDEVQGDKAEIWYTEYLKKYSFPVFEDEKFIGENYIWCQLGENYNVYSVNDIIYFCDYLEGGLTKLGRKLRIQSPKGGMVNSKVLLKKCYPLKYRIKNAILYDCYSFFAKRKIIESIYKSDFPFLTLAAVLPGYFLFRYWRYLYGR